jgi:outer membrane receptor protein involved in Fe transport
MTLGSRWFGERVDIGLRIRYNPENGQSETQSTIGRTTGTKYTLVDLYGFWQLDEALRLSLTVDNLHDDAYYRF